MKKLTQQLKTAFKHLFPITEDNRGTITPDQAMAFVESCSDKWSTYKSLDVKKNDDGEQVVWEVTATYADTDSKDAPSAISWHVWQVAEGEHGYGHNREMPTIYGEW